MLEEKRKLPCFSGGVGRGKPRESPIPSACRVHTLPQVWGQEGKALEEGPTAPSFSDVYSRMVLSFVKETGLRGCRNKGGKEGPQCKMSLFATQITLDRKDFSPQNGGSIGRVELEKQLGPLPTWTSGWAVCDTTPWHHRERETDLVGLVNVIAGQRAQKVLQAWDVVIIDGMDDGFHHKGVFLVLRETRGWKELHSGQDPHQHSG